MLKMLCFKKAISLALAVLMCLGVFTGCKKEEKPPEVTRPSAVSKSEPPVVMNEVVDTIPNAANADDNTPKNQLEETEIEYLLPNGIRIPEYKATNAKPGVSLGGVFTMEVSGNWTCVADANKLNLYHASGISIQMVHNRLVDKFELPAIKKELARFCDGFVLTDDYSTKSIFLGSREVGQQVSLNIPHDDKVLHVMAGILDANHECLVYTISFFAEDAISTYEDLIASLMSTLKMKSQDIIIK